MELFFEHRVFVRSLKLGLKVAEGLSAAVGATTGIGEVITIVLRLLAIAAPGIDVSWGCFVGCSYGLSRMPDSPVAFATALLLHFLWVSVDMARFGEVAREVLFRSG